MNFIRIYLSFLLILLIFSLRGVQSDRKLSDKTIKIGLLIQDNKSRDAIQATELAIRKANEKGGYKGRQFQLITRSMEGPWGTGSSEAVNLIFNEKVVALLGSHDGRNAHLVEQVCAKSHVTFLSAMTGDPTLSQAFVPWYFNIIPNDLQQASILIKEIYQIKKYDKVAIVCDNSYDSNIKVKSFQKKIKEKELKEPMLFSTSGDSQDLPTILKEIRNKDPRCIVLFTNNSFSTNFIRLMRQEKMTAVVFGDLFSMDEKTTELLKGNLVRISSEFSTRPGGQTFLNDYKKSYGSKPSEIAAYAYDAANVIIEAARKADGLPDRIKAEVASINQDGVTGNIRFDDKGNRLGAAWLVTSEQ